MCQCKAIAAGESGSLPNNGRQLLPTKVVPRHYHVTLEPDFAKLDYAGTVVIDLDVAEDTNSIALHTLEIDIHSSKITSNNESIRYVD